MSNLKTILASILIVILLCLVFTSCENTIVGEGANVNYVPEVAQYNAININVPADITIFYDKLQQTTITAQQNIIELMDIYVSNATLFIDFKEDISEDISVSMTLGMLDLRQIDMNVDSEVHITDPFYSNENMRVSTSGNSKVHFYDTITCENFYYEASGSSSLDIKQINVDDKFETRTYGHNNLSIASLHSSSVVINASGSNETNLSGNCTKQFINIDGDSQYDGYNLATTASTLDATGTGDFQLNASDELTINSTGTATINYIGTPIIKSKHTL